ncbi:hypothetical protein [Prevotella sp.]|uniref:hypothetical protein n=1 Tax=Prevotella sp. TaxID=59823 RepID=UPI003F80C938
MKRIFISAIMIILSISIFGQTRFTDGMEWKTQIWNTAKPVDEYNIEISKLDGTINVDGYNALRMYCEKENEPESRTLKYYVRTDKDKVYFMLPENSSKKWYLMYDFSLAAGEGCYVYSPDYIGDNHEPYKSYIKCVSIHQAEEDLYYSVMELEEYKDEKCSEPLRGMGKWLKDISSRNGVDYNIGFGMDGKGSLLLEAKNGNNVFYSQNTSTIPHVSQSSLKYKVNGCDLIISGTKANETISVYRPDGKLWRSLTTKGNEATIRFPQSGLYILKYGDTTKNILIPSHGK